MSLTEQYFQGHSSVPVFFVVIRLLSVNTYPFHSDAAAAAAVVAAAAHIAQYLFKYVNINISNGVQAG